MNLFTYFWNNNITSYITSYTEVLLLQKLAIIQHLTSSINASDIFICRATKYRFIKKHELA